MLANVLDRFCLICGEPTPEYKHRFATPWANGPVTAQLMQHSMW